MAEKNTVYLIRCQQSGLHKIGITGKWGQRSRQLRVGSKTSVVRVVRVSDGPALEKRLHKRYDAVRVPQTEYFQLSETQLQEVLQVLEKASADCSKAATVEQGSLTRPRLEARQQRMAAAVAEKPRPQPQPDPVAAMQAQEARNRQIRADQAAARKRAQFGRAFKGWYLACYGACTVGIAASCGGQVSTGWAVLAGALNGLWVAAPAALVMSTVTASDSKGDKGTW